MLFYDRLQAGTTQRAAPWPGAPSLRRAGVAGSGKVRPGSAAPPIVHHVLRSSGRPLDTATRGAMQARFGHDFSQVRVHTDLTAAASAEAVEARAYTVGSHVVFGDGRYAPGSPAGQRLLAHELTHVVQQRGAPAPSMAGNLRIGSPSSAAEREADGAELPTSGKVGNSAGGIIQRDDEPQSSEEETKLHWPGAGQESPFQLHLDPEIEAQLAAIRATEALLNPETVRAALANADLGSLLQTPVPPYLQPSPAQPAQPIVKPGKGPDKPRPGTGGDVLKAVLAVPAVNSALSNLRTQATDRLRADWRGLSTGEKVVVITQGALLGGGLLGGVLSDPQARQFSLGLIQNKPLPVPYVPGLTFQFNLTGPNQSVQFGLDVGRFLPKSLGFGKK